MFAGRGCSILPPASKWHVPQRIAPHLGAVVPQGNWSCWARCGLPNDARAGRPVVSRAAPLSWPVLPVLTMHHLWRNHGRTMPATRSVESSSCWPRVSFDMPPSKAGSIMPGARASVLGHLSPTVAACGAWLGSVAGPGGQCEVPPNAWPSKVVEVVEVCQPSSDSVPLDAA
jgi:hypothetical protein